MHPTSSRSGKQYILIRHDFLEYFKKFETFLWDYCSILCIELIDSHSLHAMIQEVWTVCRIFKRNANHKRYCEDLSTKPSFAMDRRSSKTCSSLESNNSHEGYISFNATPSYHGKWNINNMVNHTHYHVNEKNLQFCASGQLGYISQQTPSAASSSNILNNMDDQVEHFTYENWDELGSVVEFPMDLSHIGKDTSL